MLLRNSNKYHIFGMCVCSLSHPTCAVLYCHLWPLRLYIIFEGPIRTNKSQISAFLQINLSPTDAIYAEHHRPSFLRSLKMNINLNSLLTVSVLSYMYRLRRTTGMSEKMSHVNGELTPLRPAILKQTIRNKFLTFKTSNDFTIYGYSKYFANNIQ